jgi:predicted ferric reductase
MRASPREIAFSVSGYAALALLPLALAAAGRPPPARGFWIEFGVALGFVGLAMMGLQFALTARFSRISLHFGQDTLLHFHRRVGLIGSGFLLAHPAILLVAEPSYLAYMDPRDSAIRALALWALLAMVVLLVATTVWRRPMGLAYEWWRAGHGILAVGIVFVGLVHVLRVGWYVGELWKQLLWIGMSGGAILLLLHARVVRPLRMRREPYRVTEVRPEGPRLWTIAAEPVGHPGLRYRAGQYCWLTFAKTPFALQQHPFSISTAPSSGKLEFTIKEVGDFTRGVGRIPVGAPLFLEGPYGSFVLPGRPRGELVFVGGGVGITPVASILRELRAGGGRRGARLLHGAAVPEGLLFREEFMEMEREGWLTYVPVVESPPEGWTGVRGTFDAETLAAHLPIGQHEYFVCGPEAMLDAVEGWLAERGVPALHVHGERFHIA